MAEILKYSNFEEQEPLPPEAEVIPPIVKYLEHRQKIYEEFLSQINQWVDILNDRDPLSWNKIEELSEFDGDIESVTKMVDEAGQLYVDSVNLKADQTKNLLRDMTNEMVISPSDYHKTNRLFEYFVGERFFNANEADKVYGILAAIDKVKYEKSPNNSDSNGDKNFIDRMSYLLINRIELGFDKVKQKYLEGEIDQIELAESLKRIIIDSDDYLASEIEDRHQYIKLSISALLREIDTMFGRESDDAMAQSV